MSEIIKPAEVSEVLRMQLAGLDNSVEFDPADSDKREVMAW